MHTKKTTSSTNIIVLLYFTFITLSSGCVSESKISHENPTSISNSKHQSINAKYPEPKSLEVMINVLEYYYQMRIHDYNFLNDKNSHPFETREILKIHIKPILLEAEKTNVYELNLLYPELGTEFFTKFITGLKMLLNMSKAIKTNSEKNNKTIEFGVLRSILAALSESELKKESNAEFQRLEVLLKQWEEWFSKHIDNINLSIKKKYDTEGLKPFAISASDYITLGDHYLSQNKYDSALFSFKKAIEIAPQDSVAHVKIGMVYFYKANYSQTIDACTIALKYNSQNTEAYTWRGLSYFKEDKLTDAIKDLDKAISQDPIEPNAYNYRGQIKRKQKKFESASLDFKKFLDLRPKSTEAHFYLGLVLIEMDKPQQGVVHIMDALKRMSLSTLRLSFLYESYLHNEREVETPQDVQRLTTLLHEFGKAFKNAGKHEWTQECLKLAKSSNSKNEV